tara:strand:+ start:5014 stop:5781 length:768 start_codon:yes stop_codon:yes gene_type:complete
VTNPGPQWILVTGASRGIGEAITHDLVAAGFAVVATGRNRSDTERVAESAQRKGGQCLPMPMDVSRPQDIEAVATRLHAEGILLHGLVNNAGTLGPIGHILETDMGEWIRTVEINLFGAFHCIRAFAPLFVSSKACVVNISSGASEKAMEGWSTYCASKAALAMVTRSLALEASDTCLAYGLQPGLVDTQMQSRIRASGVNPVSGIARENLLPPGDPAAIVTWLCRERPTDLAGEEFRADNPEIRRRAGLAALPA